jgi:hypothetical protein
MSSFPTFHANNRLYRPVDNLFERVAMEDISSMTEIKKTSDLIVLA